MKKRLLKKLLRRKSKNPFWVASKKTQPGGNKLTNALWKRVMASMEEK